MKIIFLLTFILSEVAWARPLRRFLPTDEATVREDFARILKKAELTGSVELKFEGEEKNVARVLCEKDKVVVDVHAGEHWGQVFYMTLQRLGFLFPHPRWQVSPKIDQIRKQCGKSFTWKPALPYHGFHFHTLHPNEWMQGFLLGKTEIAIDTVRWLARNQQNIFDLSLLRMDDEVIFKNLREPFALAKKFGIHAGITLGMAFHQQKSYKLIPLPATFFDSWSLSALEDNLTNMLKNINVSYLNLESGTSEFTPANYQRTIKWMEKSAEIAGKFNVEVVVKIHTSSNQSDPEFGNYNFLPAKANADVGILPHTVFLYGINDEKAPMYGNKNFHAIRDFMIQENPKRRTWFYPETSYYLGLDIDVPLLLTDYLLTRANDTKFLHAKGINGQLNFSTGQEAGFWLLDWSYTLFNNLDYHFDPLIGITLLGEDRDEWARILDFQHRMFIENDLISIVTFPSLGDELMPGLHQTLKRNLMSQLAENPEALKKEIEDLQGGLINVPLSSGVKNQELASLWNLTRMRLSHALNVRQALLLPDQRKEFLDVAARVRMDAQKNMDIMVKHFTRYPEAQLYEKYANPTAYQFGYLYSAKDLYYWRREEEQVREQNFSWTFMTLHSYWNLIRGWVLSR